SKHRRRDAASVAAHTPNMKKTCRGLLLVCNTTSRATFPACNEYYDQPNRLGSAGNAGFRHVSHIEDAIDLCFREDAQLPDDVAHRPPFGRCFLGNLRSTVVSDGGVQRRGNGGIELQQLATTLAVGLDAVDAFRAERVAYVGEDRHAFQK